MKGDVVKRQVGAGSNKPMIPQGAISKEIEEELEKIGKGFEKELQDNFENYYEMIIDQYQKDAKKKESQALTNYINLNQIII